MIDPTIQSQLRQPLSPDQLSYSGRGFRSVGEWRSSESTFLGNLARRVCCELAYAALTVAALVESVVRGLVLLATFGTLISPYSLLDSAMTSVLSLASTSLNLLIDPAAAFKNLFFKSPLYEFLMMKWQFFPLSEYDKKWIKAKTLGHWLETSAVATIEGKTLQLDGSFPDTMFLSVAESLDAFMKSKESQRVSFSKETASRIKEAFLFSGSCPSPAKYVQRIHNGELCFLQSGWRGHAICLAFYGNYMAISNRGDDSDETGTLQVYKIDRKRVTKETIELIIKQRYLEKDSGKDYLYEILPFQLGGIQDDLSSLFKMVEPMYAPSGNCGLSSIEGTLVFALGMQESELSSLDLVKKELEAILFRNWGALRFAKLYPPETLFDDDGWGEIATRHITRALHSKKQHIIDADYYIRKIDSGDFSEDEFRRWRGLNLIEAVEQNQTFGTLNFTRTFRNWWNGVDDSEDPLNSFDLQTG